jgi:hypothetical protein
LEFEYIVSYEGQDGETHALPFRADRDLAERQVLETGYAWRGPTVIVQEILSRPRVGVSAGTARAELRVRPPS